MERELPTINIEGTDFVVDVNNAELREKDNLENIISFFEMRDVNDGYVFEYSLKDKNLPGLFDNDTTTVRIPEMVILDPEGMARKYHIQPEAIQGKTDFDIMVDQQAFDMRVNKGVLPTVDIAGHTFYVDIRMNMLRPKDDFLSKGIVFDEIDHYFSEERSAYLIPYDPGKHEFRELDYDKITAYPENLVAVEFPFQKVLDPVGWNRNGGWDIKDNLKQTGIKAHFTAKTIPWQETYLPEIIKANLEKQKKQQERPAEKQLNSRQQRGKGRRR